MKTADSANGNAATIKDVARQAGVSIATVSRILNGSAGVSPALTERVQQAVDALGYQPNAVARALKVKESHSIGLIIPDIENPFFPALVRGVEDMARSHDYAVILCNSDGVGSEEERYIRLLHGKQVDGVIFTGGANSDSSMELLASLPIPAVSLDRQSKRVHMSSVVVDNVYGAALAVRHLVELGGRRIAFIGGSPQLSVAAERFKGYGQVLAEYGLPLDEGLILHGDFTYDSGYQNAWLLLEKEREFDAVFAANDMIAIGVIECLAARGIRVPQDVRVAGYDDIRLAGWYKPALTTVRQPVYEMGQEAVRMLLHLLGSSAQEMVEKRFRPELIVRQSTGGDE
ncbi:transcriptional regulator, LacI family [Propionispora hippei DSM 15287]|uniref:Transcriptional regulator, LacI family n=1 Tax=Propionispora hippei DSM 15287 TaxID=1123003 RepID=A0A1M6HW39_9FIRM|nr:transcriptional regulator, LacI family [Propionispora hippei DSM 15287]